LGNVPVPRFPEVRQALAIKHLGLQVHFTKDQVKHDLAFFFAFAAQMEQCTLGRHNAKDADSGTRAISAGCRLSNSSRGMFIAPSGTRQPHRALATENRGAVPVRVIHVFASFGLDQILRTILRDRDKIGLAAT
jgi:hypothetical protein